MDERVFFKDKLIQNNNLDIFFHKDVPYIYNPETFPVIKFALLNCKNLESKDFNNIDEYNDGVFIEIAQTTTSSIMKIIDVADTPLTIICDRIIREEVEYRNEDFITLIKEITNKLDTADNTNTKLYKLIEDLNKSLKKEMNIIETKFKDAKWLTSEKKQFLEGQKSILLKAMEVLSK